MAKSHVLTSFEGLSAIVTGGSSGLGFGAVERLTKLGCIVAIVDVHEPKYLPDNSYFIQTDVTNEQDVKKALEMVEDTAKKLDFLVNCAGILINHVVYDTETQTPHPIDVYEKVLKVNTIGTFNMIRLSCPLFYKNKPNEDNQRGVIINLASMAGFEAPAAFAAYSASKGAIIGMTLPLARDLAPMGIRVMSIAPGAFSTPMFNSIDPGVINAILKSAAFPKRLGHPDEFGHLVQSIIENPILNGSVIRLDSGIRFGPELE